MADPAGNPNPPDNHDPPVPPAPNLTPAQMTQFVQYLYTWFSGALGNGSAAVLPPNSLNILAPVLALPSNNPLPHADPGPPVPSNTEGISVSRSSTVPPSTTFQSSLLVMEENVPKSTGAGDPPTSPRSENPESSLYNPADAAPSMSLPLPIGKTGENAFQEPDENDLTTAVEKVIPADPPSSPGLNTQEEDADFQQRFSPERRGDREGEICASVSRRSLARERTPAPMDDDDVLETTQLCSHDVLMRSGSEKSGTPAPQEPSETPAKSTAAELSARGADVKGIPMAEMHGQDDPEEAVSVNQKAASRELSPAPSANILESSLPKDDLVANRESPSASENQEDDVSFLWDVLKTRTWRFPADLFDGVALLLLWAVSCWEKGVPFDFKLIELAPKDREARVMNFRLLEALMRSPISKKRMRKITAWNKECQIELSRLLCEVRELGFGKNVLSSDIKDYPELDSYVLCRREELDMNAVEYEIDWTDHTGMAFTYRNTPFIPDASSDHAVEEAVVDDVEELGDPVLSEEIILTYIREALRIDVYCSLGKLRDGVVYLGLTWLKVRNIEDTVFGHTDIEERTMSSFEGRKNLRMLKRMLPTQDAHRVDIEKLIHEDPECHRVFASWLLCTVLEGISAGDLIKPISRPDTKQLKYFHTWIKSAVPPVWHEIRETGDAPVAVKRNTARMPSLYVIEAQSQRDKNKVATEIMRDFFRPSEKENSEVRSTPTSSPSRRLHPLAMKTAGQRRVVGGGDDEEKATLTPPTVPRARTRSHALVKSRGGSAKEVSTAKRRRSSSTSASRKRVKGDQESEEEEASEQGDESEEAPEPGHESEEASEPELQLKSGKGKKKKKKPAMVKEDNSFSWHPAEGAAKLRTDKAVAVLKKVIKGKQKCFEMGCCGRIYFGGTSANAIRHLTGLPRNSTGTTGKGKASLACEKFRNNGATRLRYLLDILPQQASTQFQLVGDGSVVGVEVRENITPLRIVRGYHYSAADAETVQKLEVVIRNLIKKGRLTANSSDDEKIQQVEMWRVEKDAEAKAAKAVKSKDSKKTKSKSKK